jgi:hypothetical protein
MKAVAKTNLHNFTTNILRVRKERLEITTMIPCPVRCMKYCPQEVLVKRYKSTPIMDMDTFMRCIANVPQNVQIWFSGFSEPFANPRCMNMIKTVYEMGLPCKP